MQASTSSDAFDALAGARHSDPFSVLGPHVEGGRLTLRAFNPSAAAIDVVHDGERIATLEVRPLPDYCPDCGSNVVPFWGVTAWTLN